MLKSQICSEDWGSRVPLATGSWGEDVELMTGPDGEIPEEVMEQIERGVDSEGVECLVGHAGDDLSRGRVLILLEVF